MMHNTIPRVTLTWGKLMFRRPNSILLRRNRKSNTWNKTNFPRFKNKRKTIHIPLPKSQKKVLPNHKRVIHSFNFRNESRLFRVRRKSSVRLRLAARFSRTKNLLEILIFFAALSWKKISFLTFKSLLSFLQPRTYGSETKNLGKRQFLFCSTVIYVYVLPHKSREMILQTESDEKKEKRKKNCYHWTVIS